MKPKAERQHQRALKKIESHRRRAAHSRKQAKMYYDLYEREAQRHDEEIQLLEALLYE